MWQPQRPFDGDRISFPLRAPAALVAMALEAPLPRLRDVGRWGVPEVEESALLLVRLGPDRG